jgi:hypothetical protein
MKAPRLVVAALLLLASCQQMREVTGTENCDDPSLTPSEQQLCKDNSSFNKTVAGGAILGGLIGAGTGALACVAAHTSTNPLVCGAIGMGAGLFAGGVAGYVVAKKQQGAKDQKRAIDGVTDDLRQQNQSLRAAVATARNVAREDRQKLAKIDSATRSGQMSADEARAERERVAADSRHLDGIISHLEQQQQNFEGAGQQLNQSSSDYNREIVDMRSQIAALKQQKETLDRAISATG